MPASQISFHPGESSIVEIRVATPVPLDWLTLVRHSFMSLLECLHEPLPPDAAYLQGEAIGLLYSLNPLPSQMKAGVAALETPPDVSENAGYYFTPDGLVIRLQVPATFEGLDTALRALLAVGQHSGCRLSDEIRAGFFELLGALIPSPTDISAAYKLSPISQHL
ncbi:MAG: hypothetical protein L6Q97_04120 [Thermoanaerobaculia bacterium]|nr:hypothetical protein [Thermoanaerobaculia bacterium]